MSLIAAKYAIVKVFGYDEPVEAIEDTWHGYGKVFKFKFNDKIVGGLLADVVEICRENKIWFSIISENNLPVLVIHE